MNCVGKCQEKTNFEGRIFLGKNLQLKKKSMKMSPSFISPKSGFQRIKIILSE